MNRKFTEELSDKHGVIFSLIIDQEVTNYNKNVETFFYFLLYACVYLFLFIVPDIFHKLIPHTLLTI